MGHSDQRLVIFAPHCSSKEVRAIVIRSLGDRFSLALADASNLRQLALAMCRARHERHEDGIDEEHDRGRDGEPVRPAVRQRRQLTHVEVGAEHRHRHHDQRSYNNRIDIRLKDNLGTTPSM